MRSFYLILSLFCLLFCFSQQPEKPNSLAIYEAIQKLNFFGNVMYVAAHPDDENTRLITYFSKHYHAHTTYISLTRGDGGQNLIGSELNEKLGLIRTQELLEARKIDGGHQLFSRAIDFGFSKNPEETFSKWDKEQVLADLVLAIRTHKPDIIINRFDHRTPGTTHGHHTSSAILSMEAYSLASQEAAFPEQLELVDIWQPKAIYFNDSWFFYESKEAFENAEHKDHLAINIGQFYAPLGLANNEIAALSRSMHKSQGFGNTGTRGDQVEYLELLDGKLPRADNLFEHIETSWKRLPSRKAGIIQNLLLRAQEQFDFQQPSSSLPLLLEAYQMLQTVEDSYWKKKKIADLKEIIIACSGLFLEARATSSYANPGNEIQVLWEATNQSRAAIDLISVSILEKEIKLDAPLGLSTNQKNEHQLQIKIPQNQNYTSPFWLAKPHGSALYEVDEIQNRIKPQLQNTLPVVFSVKINNVLLHINRDLIYKYTDPVAGEVYEPFLILPPVSLSFEKDILVFSKLQTKEVELEVTHFGDAQDFEIEFNSSPYWKVEPKKLNISFSKPKQSKKVKLNITPLDKASRFELSATASNANGDFSTNVELIDYPHIPKQSLVQPNRLKLINLNVQKKGEKVAYIPGAGDEVSTAIAELGYEVEILSVEDIASERLSPFDAIVVGIRAFNIFEQLDDKKDLLFEYVKQGGNLIVQYNTSRGLKTAVSPLSLKLNRGRVTDEKAEVIFLEENHPVLQSPNSISSADFDNWIQERGLYFAEEWDKAFTPILSMKDPGEDMQEGSLLIARYGEGYFSYTGLSFFRQLPAGVDGAYRLFANLLSLGNE